MKTKIIRIGNSRGVRIPKPLLEEAGLDGDVELRVVESGIVIESAASTRQGWEDAAARLRGRGEDALVHEPVPTAFDATGWVWE
jgi:antitoxin MazE